jgi:hypothetical protein
MASVVAIIPVKPQTKEVRPSSLPQFHASNYQICIHLTIKVRVAPGEEERQHLSFPFGLGRMTKQVQKYGLIWA